MSTARKVNSPDSHDVEVFTRALVANGFPPLSLKRRENIGNFDNTKEFRYPPSVSKALKDDPDFLKTAQENQWSERKARGLPSHTCIFEFLKTVYTPWIGKGMTRADLKAVDSDAWLRLRDRLRNDSLPDWLPLPTRAETFVPSETDSTAYEATMEARRLNRERMRLVRSLTPP